MPAIRRYEREYDARAFGAVGDGATDSTAAIQAAINAASAAGGGTVHIPRGTYIVGTSSYLKAASSVHVVGDGPGATVLKMYAGSAQTAMLDDSSGAVSRFSLEQLTVDQNSVAHWGVRLTHASGSTDCAVRNVEFLNTTGVYTPLVFSTGQRFSVNDCSFVGPAGTSSLGIQMYSGCKKSIIARCVFRAVNTPIRIGAAGQGASNISVVSNVFTGCGAHHVSIIDSDDVIVASNNMSDTYYEPEAPDATSAVSVTAGSNQITVSGNIIDNAGQISVYDSSDCVIVSNFVADADRAGIEVNDNTASAPPQDAMRIVVADNQIINAAQHGIFVSAGTVILRGNIVHSAGYDGIKVAEGGDNVLIDGNIITDVGQAELSGSQYGVQISNGADDNGVTNAVIANNIIRDDQGTPTMEYGIAVDNSEVTMRVTNNIVAGASSANLYFNSFSSCLLDHHGAGTPEGSVKASIGSVWRRTDGGTTATLYVKESGTGNTGWVAK